ncbi:MAG: hypothetical protein IJ998_03445 [Alistipes sp.]|nr:hypothetical protein [Alistipes sp.]
MKKFLMMAVVAFGMLATACSKDEVAQPVVGGEESIATFTVEAPVMATRYGEGTTATELNWAVYDQQGNYLFGGKDLDGYKKPLVDKKTTVKIPFVNGMAYNILFWAEAPGTKSPYAVNWEAKTVTYADGTKLANDENFDAFFCYYPVSVVTGPVTETVELKRPFAQLRIATNDTAAAELSQIVVTDTKVTVANTYTAFDFEDGDVTGTTSTVEFAYNNDVKKAAGQIVVGGNTYDLLTVNYLFGYKGDKKLIDATLTYKYGGTEVSAEYNSVPIQQNYRTNIIGSLLTSEGKFNIDIEEGFADEEHNVEVVTVASAQDLQEAINNAPTGEETNITLTDDIDLNDLFGNTRAAETNTVTLAKGKKLVLDLNGFKLTGTDNTAKNYGLIQNNGDLTIVGPGTIETTATINSGWNRYSAVVSNNPGAVLTVENGAVLEHKGGTDMAYGIDILTNGTIGDVKATINGATIKSTYRAVRQFLNSNSKKNELIIKAGSVIEGAANNYGVFFHDPSTKANNGTLIIEEGATVQGVYLFVTAGSTEWPVEFSIAASSITGEKGVVAANVPAGLAVGIVDGVYTKVEIDTEAYVANIGTQGYETLQAAIEAVQEGETISLTKDLEFTEGINGNGISYTDNKSFTLDLKGKTVTSDLGNNALRFKIGDGNEVTNTEVTINIVNGKIVSGANNWCAISAAVADNSSNKLTLNLEKLDVENYKAGDYAVKAYAGTVINAENVDITSSYGGGFYAVGGELVLDNCTANQKGLHTAPYMSMAVAVSTKGKATVNSGTYTTEPSAASDGYNQGTSHGSWAAGVMNSGGELIINGGTFANGNFGDDALATAARGLIFGDTASNIVINDGVFNALKNIIDYQNNLGAQPNPYIVINGGDFSADPTDVTSYGSVVVAEGKVAVQQANGRWTLVDGVATAEALAEAVAVGGNVVLGADITVSEPVVIPEGKTVILNMNGKTLSAADEANTYALNNHGTLTITGNGVVNARGIYNGYSSVDDNHNSSAKLIIENGTFNAKGTNGGACIFNYGIVEVNGGQFTSIGGYSLNNQNGSSMTNMDATVTGGIYNVGETLTINGGKIATTRGGYTHAIYHNGGVLTVNNGEFEGNGNEVIHANSCVANINGGSFKKVEKTSYLLAGSQMTINDGTFVAHESNPAAHPVRPDVIVKGGTFNYKHTNIADGYKIIDNGDGTWSVVAE